MNCQQLQQSFGIPNVLTVEEPVSDMIAGVLNSRVCHAKFLLHGAHITEFAPMGHDEILFVSGLASNARGQRYAEEFPSASRGLEAIRGKTAFVRYDS